MATVICRSCGAEHPAGFGSPLEYPWCDDRCKDDFDRTVRLLENGGDPATIGVEPDSRLWREALRELMRRQARDYWQSRDYAESEYERSRRPLRPLYPC
jgi:hypothetical protein